MVDAKLFRDPVHGYIVLPKEFMALVSTREFQRLRRIRQLGLSFLTYHGAEHSRFAHSLGVFHLFVRLETELERKGFKFSEAERLLGRCVGLLHDIGHGPLSHVLEGVITPDKKHEAWAIEIITAPTEIRCALENIDPQLPKKICQVLQGDPKWQLIKNVISSQLDIDRMDYLLRDALMTGTSYGHFDLARLLAVLELNDKGTSLIVNNKGLMAAEQFVFARYYAYWQIYFHKTTRGAEKVLQMIWKRARELFRRDLLPHELIPASLRSFLADDWDWEDYLSIDDSDIWIALKTWQNSTDPILSDLSKRILNRELFKPVKVVESTSVNFLDLLDKIKEILRNNGYDPDYYLLWDAQSDVAYDYYTSPEEEDTSKPPIWVLDRSGTPRDITRLSDSIRAIAGKRKIVEYFYVPDEKCRSEIEKLVKK
ncbi:HD domain-containing protein [Thermanaeromonas sp.]|uniref:HD domain-containing protein n=1 Tax=Thermanaeromonas sp. TaxID=2003697 RepID=UPI00262A06DE|nr:HD domain-containing protein [Thermanaeromonas sp.]